MNTTLDLVRRSGDILASVTLVPWVLRAWANEQRPITGGGSFARSVLVLHTIVQAPMTQPPEIDDHLPEGAVPVRSMVYPVQQVLDTPPGARRGLPSDDYRLHLLWRKARALGKQRRELDPWVDYDPILIDESVERWVHEGRSRYAGD